jgi:hypothetical protein
VSSCAYLLGMPAFCNLTVNSQASVRLFRGVMSCHCEHASSALYPSLSTGNVQEFDNPCDQMVTTKSPAPESSGISSDRGDAPHSAAISRRLLHAPDGLMDTFNTLVRRG